MTESIQRRIAWILAVAFAVVLCDYVWFYGQYPADDAYIFMRIARAWVETGSPYFNPGEPVMGHSSHLWLWLVAALFRVVGPHPDAVVVLSIPFYVLCFALTVVLLSRLWPNSPLKAVLLAILVVTVYLAPQAAMQLETPVAMAALLGTLLLVDGGRDRWFGFVAGLSVLGRYEFVLLAGLGLLLARRRRDYILGALAPLIAFLTFTLGYFHTVVPQTIRAKGLIYSGGRKFLLTFIQWPGTRNVVLQWLALLVLVSGMVAILLLARRRAAPVRWPLLAGAFAALLFASHVAKGTLMFGWYWPVVLVPLFLAALAVTDVRRWAWAIPIGLALVTPRLGSAGLGAAEGYALRDRLQHPEFKSNLRVVQYREIGASIRERSPDATVLAVEIGGLGWSLYPNRIIDGVGLVSPDALRHHPMKVPEERSSGLAGCVPPAYVAEKQPDYVVAMEIHDEALRRSVANGQLAGFALAARWPIFPAAEKEQYGLPDRLWASSAIDVFQRR